jgi:hypothetical protein
MNFWKPKPKKPKKSIQTISIKEAKQIMRDIINGKIKVVRASRKLAQMKSGEIRISTQDGEYSILAEIIHGEIAYIRNISKGNLSTFMGPFVRDPSPTAIGKGDAYGEFSDVELYPDKDHAKLWDIFNSVQKFGYFEKPQYVPSEKANRKRLHIEKTITRIMDKKFPDVVYSFKIDNESLEE